MGLRGRRLNGWKVSKSCDNFLQKHLLLDAKSLFAQPVLVKHVIGFVEDEDLYMRVVDDLVESRY